MIATNYLFASSPSALDPSFLVEHHSTSQLGWQNILGQSIGCQCGLNIFVGPCVEPDLFPKAFPHDQFDKGDEKTEECRRLADMSSRKANFG